MLFVTINKKKIMCLRLRDPHKEIKAKKNMDKEEHQLEHCQG